MNFSTTTKTDILMGTKKHRFKNITQLVILSSTLPFHYSFLLKKTANASSD